MCVAQIRRRKCNGDENELLCELRPTIESYCTVARHIQLTHGIHDNDVRFFLAADEPETYTQVPLPRVKCSPQRPQSSSIAITADRWHARMCGCMSCRHYVQLRVLLHPSVCGLRRFMPAAPFVKEDLKREKTPKKWQGIWALVLVTIPCCNIFLPFQCPDKTSGFVAQVMNILGADRVIYTDNGIAPTSSEKGVINSADNPGTLESALQDMALMSQCNDLVMTVASSFGYVAAAWGGYAPVRNFSLHGSPLPRLQKPRLCP